MTWLGTGQFRWSIGTNGTIGTNRKGCHSNGSIGVLATLWDSNTILCTNSQTLYTEGLVRLRRRQIISGLSEIIFRIAALWEKYTELVTN